MQNFIHEMLHDSPAAQRIMSLWKVSNVLVHSPECGIDDVQEYEEQQTDGLPTASVPIGDQDETADDANPSGPIGDDEETVDDGTASIPLGDDCHCDIVISNSCPRED